MSALDHAFLPCPTPLLTINHHWGVCHHPGCIAGPERHTTADDVAMIDGAPYEICLTCRHGWPADALPEHGYLCPKDIATKMSDSIPEPIPDPS